MALSISEAINQCNAVPGDDDGTIRRLLAAAQATVETDSGICLTQRVIKLSFWDIKWDNQEIEFPEPLYPVNEISSASYRNSEGAVTELSSSLYQKQLDARPPRVKPLPNTNWPTIADGYYDSLVFIMSVGTVTAPEQARQAIALLVAHWFLNREAAISGSIPKEIELAYHNLIDQLKLYRYP